MSAVRSFTSIVGSDIASYITLKKALGRRFAGEAAILADLDRFLAARSCDLSAKSFAAWCLTIARLTPTVRRNRMRIARKQLGQGHHESRRAKAALDRSGVDERPLDGGEISVAGNALDRRYRSIAHVDRERQARSG